IFALNPFVYARILSGQWFVVMGYAMLPIILYALLKLLAEPRLRNGAYLGGALSLVGAFSIHMLLLAVLICALGTIFSIDRLWNVRAQAYLSAAACIGVFLISSGYWIVPAMLRAQPIEERFDRPHWEAFAAAP